MQVLKLHSFGQKDHIKSLKKHYDSLIKRSKGNSNLTEIEKNKELKNLTMLLEKEKRDSKDNLY